MRLRAVGKEATRVCQNAQNPKNLSTSQADVIRQEQESQPSDAQHCHDNDSRMTDMLALLLKWDRHVIELAMKQARKVTLLKLAYSQNMPYALCKLVEFGTNFKYMGYILEDIVQWFKSKHLIRILIHHPSLPMEFRESFIYHCATRGQNVTLISILLTNKHAVGPRIEKAYQHSRELGRIDALKVFWKSGRVKKDEKFGSSSK